MTENNGDSDFQSVENHFLVAMPGMLSDVFEGGLVYICSHDADGAMGFLVNRPTNLTIDSLSSDDAVLNSEYLTESAVYFGGPVSLNQGFILHESGPVFKSTHSNRHLAFTSSRDIFTSITEGQGPDNFMLMLGYSGWGGGQLEQELADNCWLTLEADPKIIFDCDYTERYRRALASIGVDPSMLSSQSGHA